MPVSPFVYRSAPGWAPVRESRTAAEQLIAAANAAAAGGVARPEEEFRTREKKAWEQGFNEGVARERTGAEASINEQREAIANALRAFVKERESYFHRVEAEVVSLALAIVRKILRRESQLDPLLLTGLVRVALEKMAVTQNVRLRVHPSQIPVWQEHFSHQSEMAVTPELVGDAALEQNQCMLETELGVTELNLESQLKEIEQGLFDLLAQRPGADKVKALGS
jgi:flagellar assembly protein FliH